MYDVITIGDSINDIFVKPCSTHFCSAQINLHRDQLCLRHGDKINVDEMYHDIGGGAANVAVGLSRLGLKTAIISMVGKDTAGDKIKERFIAESVSEKYLRINAKISTSTSIAIVYNKERTILIYRGVKDYSSFKIPANISTKWIYLAPISQEFSSNYKNLVSLASERNINIAINPGSRQILEGRDELLKLLRVTTLLIINLEEATELVKLSKFTNIKKIISTIKNYGPKFVIITDGKNGAYFTDGLVFWGINIYHVEVIDPTGAGDAFSSGFLASFIQNNDLKLALQSAIINSALATEKYGAETNLQNSQQIQKLLKLAPKLYNL